MHSWFYWLDSFTVQLIFIVLCIIKSTKLFFIVLVGHKIVFNFFDAFSQKWPATRSQIYCSIAHPTQHVRHPLRFLILPFFQKSTFFAISKKWLNVDIIHIWKAHDMYCRSWIYHFQAYPFIYNEFHIDHKQQWW